MNHTFVPFTFTGDFASAASRTSRNAREGRWLVDRFPGGPVRVPKSVSVWDYSDPDNPVCVATSPVEVVRRSRRIVQIMFCVPGPSPDWPSYPQPSGPAGDHPFPPAFKAAP